MARYSNLKIQWHTTGRRSTGRTVTRGNLLPATSLGSPSPSTGTRSTRASATVSLLTSSLHSRSLTSAAGTRVRARREWVGLAEDLFKDGYQNVTSIDISPTVIKQMVERYKEEFPALKCKFQLPRLRSPNDGREEAGVRRGEFRHRAGQGHTRLHPCTYTIL